MSKFQPYQKIILELVSFVKRPGMYIGKEDINQIFSFLLGIELFTKFKLRFHCDLSDFIFKKYEELESIQSLKSNLNVFTLIQQLEILEKELNDDKISIFKKESMLFLVYISDQKLKKAYRSTLAKEIGTELHKNIGSKDEPFNNTFSGSRISQLYKELIEWPGETFSIAQLNLLKSISEEDMNRNLKWHKKKEGEIDDKSKIREISLTLIHELTRDNNGYDVHLP
jgi:hypothetical protein